MVRHRKSLTSRSTALASLLALALGLGAFGGSSAQASTAYVIEQRDGGGLSRLTMARSGLRFETFVPARGVRAKPKPLLGTIIRYRDANLFLLDPEHKRYDSVPLASAISSYEKELARLAQAQPSAKLPAPPGSKPPSGQAPLKTPRATLKRLSLSARIGPVRARAFLLSQGPLRERLWYADVLPRPPAHIRALLAKALGGSAAGPLGRALRAYAAQIPLRIDERKGRHWRNVLRTVRIKRTTLSAHTLETPRGYTKQVLLPSAHRAQAHTADVPADPIRCGLLIVSPITCAVDPGPVSEHPAIWAFYWGTHFSEHTDFVSAINHGLENFVGDQFADGGSQAFWGPLGQYGVGQGRLLGYEIINEKPDSSVGSWNFFDVDWFVLTHRFGSDAPNYWWRFSDEDPIFAIFVDESEVSSSGWAGYHFFTPTEGILFSFLVHPAMPWLIVKVPGLDSLTHERDSPPYRQAVDKTTERASHEFVEAATDPYPFLSWADPLKEPIWEEGEIGDICQQGNTSPFAKDTRIIKFGTAVEPFWSNSDNACVPNAQPSARIAFPAGGETYSWHAPVTFIAQTDDVYDGGPVADSGIRWDSDKDGRGVGYGHIFTTTKLSPGTHHITAVVTDSQGGTTTTGPITINVVVQPPTVRIDEPANGASFASDQTVPYRGSAFDPADGDLDASATWSVDGTAVGKGASLLLYRIPTEGTHTVTLSATNSGGVSSSASITVDVGPPTGKPSVRITSPENESNFGVGEPITFSATAETLGGATVPESGYRWSDSLEGPLGTGKTITHTLSGSSCEIFFHQVTVTVTDSFNRTATDTITLKVGSIC